jgi:hypothetical protein
MASSIPVGDESQEMHEVSFGCVAGSPMLLTSISQYMKKGKYESDGLALTAQSLDSIVARQRNFVATDYQAYGFNGNKITAGMSNELNIPSLRLALGDGAILFNAFPANGKPAKLALHLITNYFTAYANLPEEDRHVQQERDYWHAIAARAGIEGNLSEHVIRKEVRAEYTELQENLGYKLIMPFGSPRFRTTTATADLEMWSGGFGPCVNARFNFPMKLGALKEFIRHHGINKPYIASHKDAAACVSAQVCVGSDGIKVSDYIRDVLAFTHNTDNYFLPQAKQTGQ